MLIVLTPAMMDSCRRRLPDIDQDHECDGLCFLGNHDHDGNGSESHERCGSEKPEGKHNHAGNQAKPQVPKSQVSMQEHAKNQNAKYWCDVPGCGETWSSAWMGRQRFCNVYCKRCNNQGVEIKCCKNCLNRVNSNRSKKSLSDFTYMTKSMYETDEMICRELHCSEDYTIISHETLYYVPCSGEECPFKAVYKLHKDSQFEVLNRELEAAAEKLGPCAQCNGKGRVPVTTKPKSSSGRTCKIL